MKLFGLEIKRSAEPLPPSTPAAAENKSVVTVTPWDSLIPVSRGVDFVSSPDLAMKIAAVYRCADILSKGVAQLPMEVATRRSGGYFAADESDPLTYVLGTRPNARQTAFELIRNLMLQTVMQGNAYLLPLMDGRGDWSEIILLSPNSCTYDVYSNTYIVADAINRISGTFQADEIIHIKNLTLDGGYVGRSTLSFAGRVMAISSNADGQGIEDFKSGGLVRGFVSGKESATQGLAALTDNQIDTVASDLEKQMASGRNIFNLPGEMNFHQISLSPKDIQLLENKQFNVLEICRYFGVHPDKVFAQQATNYKASEMSQVAFLTDTLQPYIRQITQEFQIKLIPRSLNNDVRICFNLDGLMQTDLATQAAYIEKTIATGVRTVNDWRKHLGQPPVKGGDVPLVSANLLELGSPKLRGQ